MRYEAFVKSDYYETAQALLVIYNHFFLVASLLLIVGLPTWGYLQIGGYLGIGLGLVVVFFTVDYWGGLFRQWLYFKPKLLFWSLVQVAKTTTFFYSAVVIANLWLFARFTLATQLTPWALLCLFLLACMVGLTLYYGRLVDRNLMPGKALFLGWMPTVCQLFFLVNFLFSRNPVVETYSFVHQERVLATKNGQKNGEDGCCQARK